MAAFFKDNRSFLRLDEKNRCFLTELDKFYEDIKLPLLMIGLIIKDFLGELAGDYEGDSSPSSTYLSSGIIICFFLDIYNWI